jgi:salicylate hydroxylase
VKIAVVGGGLGGLSAALSLLAEGFDVDVFEQASQISEIGAGIQVSPNASRVLYGLGLADPLAAIGTLPVAWNQRRWDDGRTLLRTPLGDTMLEAFGFPHYQVHRADLVSLLLDAMPPDRVHVGRRVVGVAERDDRVEATFADGESVEADLLVGADGIHSTVREALHGPEHPHFTGCVAYRGLVPAERVRALELEVVSEVWLGPGGHLVHYFVQGGRLVNVVAIVEQDTWLREAWTDRGNVDDVLAAYRGWNPQVRRMLEALDETFVWALFDRPPLDHWSRGRMTLLGDACHPMLPFMAQGAAQAIEDGATLTACLVDGEPADVPGTLQRYESLRRPRTARLQELSAANKIRFHLPDGPEQQRRDDEMAAGGTDWSVEAVAWLYGHDARGLAESPAWST